MRLDVAPNGAAVVGWSRNYQKGAWLRHVRPGGKLGHRVKVSDAALFDIDLQRDGDGVAVSTKHASDGKPRIIRVTKIRNGYIRVTRGVARNDDKPSVLRAGLYPGGRTLVSWGKAGRPARILTVIGR